MVKRGGERVTLRRHPEAEVTSSPTCSSNFYLALQPPVCPPHLGHWPACSLVLCPGRQLVCLKPTQRHRHAHTETQRWKEREGGYEGHIHRPWNRPGLVQVRASLPGHLSDIWVFQGSDVKVSTLLMTWAMTRLLNYVCNTYAFQQHSLLALFWKTSCIWSN